MKQRFIAPIAFFLFFSSFSLAQNKGELISDSLILSFDLEDIQAIYADFGIPEFFFPIDYEEIELHKIVYWTNAAKGDSLTKASGLVTFPVNTECDFPLMNYNHGRLDYEHTLSELNANGMQHFIGIPFAATGYVSVLPDFLGYGETPLSHPHPFTHSETEASSTIDMLIAAKSLCNENDVVLNEQLFLLGYSNGGHVTMAVHKELEDNYTNEFTVTASAPGSGAYDLSGTMRDSMFYSEAFSNPAYIAFTSISYQFLYENIYDDISEMFVAPYDSLIPLIYNRYEPQSDLEDSLIVPGYLMLQPDYFNEVVGNATHPFNVALAENDVYNWIPQAPLRMYYCEADERIPYQNTLVAYNYMTSNGATSVEAVSAGSDEDHNGCAAPSLVASKLWFDTFREECSPIAIADVNLDDLKFYPNPFMDYLTISGLNVLNKSSLELNIYNLVGQRLWSGSLDNEENINVQTDQLIPGSYLFEISSDDFRMGKILMKTR